MHAKRHRSTAWLPKMTVYHSTELYRGLWGRCAVWYLRKRANRPYTWVGWNEVQSSCVEMQGADYELIKLQGKVSRGRRRGAGGEVSIWDYPDLIEGIKQDIGANPLSIRADPCHIGFWRSTEHKVQEWWGAWRCILEMLYVSPSVHSKCVCTLYYTKRSIHSAHF